MSHRPPPRRGGAAAAAGAAATTPPPAALTAAQQQELEAKKKELEAGRTTVDYLLMARREAHRAIELGEDSTTQLRVQGETLDRVDRALDRTEYELKVSDRIVKNMSGLGGMVASWFWRTPKPPPPQMPLGDGGGRGGDGATTPPPQQSKPQPKAAAATAAAAGKKTAVPAAAGEQRKQKQEEAEAERPPGALTHEEERLLDGLAFDLAQMRTHATAQRDLLAQQNAQLDGLADKTDRVRAHMARTEGKVRKLL